METNKRHLFVFNFVKLWKTTLESSSNKRQKNETITWRKTQQTSGAAILIFTFYINRITILPKPRQINDTCNLHCLLGFWCRRFDLTFLKNRTNNAFKPIQINVICLWLTFLGLGNQADKFFKTNKNKSHVRLTLLLIDQTHNLVK